MTRIAKTTSNQPKMRNLTPHIIFPRNHIKLCGFILIFLILSVLIFALKPKESKTIQPPFSMQFDINDLDTPFSLTPINSSATTKQLNIFFLKVHKTGSSTFRNILQRLILTFNLATPVFEKHHPYPSRNMLRHLVPIKTILHQHDRTKHVKVSMEQTIQENQCNVMCVHSVFNRSQIDRLMPNDTLFVASLREPFSQFKSAFNFWKLEKRYGIKHTADPFLEYFKNVSKYEKLLPGSLYNNIANREHIKLSYSKNYMAYEYGFDLDRIYNKSYVDEHLRFINETFKSVILLEKFDESLLLLRSHTNWTFEDIIYLQQRKKAYTFKEKQYSSEILKRHQEMSPVDYRIYDMFFDRHRTLVRKAGSRFQQELAAFRGVLDTVRDFCLPIEEKAHHLKKEKAKSTTILDLATLELEVEATMFSDSFLLSGANCLVLSMSELFLRTAVKLMQYPSICKTQQTWKTSNLSHKRYRVFCEQSSKMIYNIGYNFYNDAW